MSCIWYKNIFTGKPFTYTYKTYAKLGTPLVGCLLLAVPVAAAWIAKKRSSKERRVETNQRFYNTVDVFWVRKWKPGLSDDHCAV